jgi:hypothetical protein
MDKDERNRSSFCYVVPGKRTRKVLLFARLKPAAGKPSLEYHA